MLTTTGISDMLACRLPFQLHGCTLPSFTSSSSSLFYPLINSPFLPSHTLLGETKKPSMRTEASLPHVPCWLNWADGSWLMIDRQCNKQDAFYYMEGFPEMWQEKTGGRWGDWWWLVEGRSPVWVAPLLFLHLRRDRVSGGMLMLGAQQPWNRFLASLCGLINRG